MMYTIEQLINRILDFIYIKDSKNFVSVRTLKATIKQIDKNNTRMQKLYR